MVMRTGGVAALLTTSLLLASPGLASGPSISVSPNPVHRGHVVRVYGAVPGCVRGDQVTLLSKAFSRRHTFASVPAVFATIGARHKYSVRTTIPARRTPRTYTVSGRCGGGNLGVSASLRVLR